MDTKIDENPDFQGCPGKLAIIVDLDGTLCNTVHRQHHMNGPKKDWKAFYGAIAEDDPNEWCRTIVEMHAERGYEILFVSGRPGQYREVTETWLKRVMPMVQYTLLMRPEGDFRKDCDVKLEIYQQHIEPYYNIAFALDDRQQVVDMWRAQGITCLQCAKGDF